MNNPNPDPNPEPDHDRQAITPTPLGGALTALQTLEAALNKVVTSSFGGRSGQPMMQFKREGDGTWLYGQKQTIPEDGSTWAVNVTTFKHGYLCFNEANKVLGEHLVSVSLPMPDAAKLPDKGFPWKEEWAVGMKCTNGSDAGTEVVYKTTTVGGIQAVTGLIEVVRDRLNGGTHDSKVAPIVLLEKSSYQHQQYGRQWNPVLTIVDWMPLDGPAPAPAPAPASPPQPAEQPRRRRVV